MSCGATSAGRATPARQRRSTGTSYNAPSRRSRSASSFQAPTHARKSERTGQIAYDDAGLGQAKLARVPSAYASSQLTSVRRPARHHAAAGFAQRVGEPARPGDRTRLDLLPAG